MTTTRRGSGGRPGTAAVRRPGRRRRRRAAARSRRRISASRLTSARSARRSSRSVTTPTVCGRSAQASNVDAALVVDEHERQVVGARAGGERRRRACAAARSCPSRSCRRRARAGRRGRGRSRRRRRPSSPIDAARSRVGAGRRASRRRWRWGRRSDPAPCCSLSAPMPDRRGAAPSMTPTDPPGRGARRGPGRPAAAVAAETPAACTGSASWAADVSGHQRATPIDPISSTLRHIAGAASPAGDGDDHGDGRRGAEEAAQRAGPLGEQVGPVGDDHDVAAVAVVEPGEARRRAGVARRRRRRRWPVPSPARRAGATAPVPRGGVVGDDDEAPVGRADPRGQLDDQRTHDGAARRRRRRQRGARTEIDRHGGVVEPLGRGDDAGELRRHGRRRASSRATVPLDRRPSRA